MFTRLKYEMYRGLILTTYFTVFFIALDYFHYAVLKVADDVTSGMMLIGIVKAALCAKFLIVSQTIFPIRFSNKHTLIVHILRRSVLYVLMVIVLMAIEEAVVAKFIQHKDIISSVTGLKPGTGTMFLSLAFLYWIMVVPYAILSALNTYYGNNKLVKLLLSKPSQPVANE